MPDRCFPDGIRSGRGLFVLVMLLAALSPLWAQFQSRDQSPSASEHSAGDADNPASPRMRDREDWYSNAVLQGRLLQDPIYSGDGSFIFFTDDKRIQCTRFGSPPLWTYDLSRLPAGSWYPDRTVIYVPLRSGAVDVISRNSGDRLYRLPPDNFLSGENGEDGTRYFVYAGRSIAVDTAGRVFLWDSTSTAETPRFSWDSGFSDISDVLLDSFGQLLFLHGRSVSIASIDGRIIAERDTGRSWDGMYESGGRIYLTGYDDGSYMVLDQGGNVLRSGAVGVPGRLFTELSFRGSGQGVAVSYDSSHLWLTGPEGRQYLLLQLEDQWKFTNISRGGQWLLLGDGAWRVHRIDLIALCYELFDRNLDVSSAPPPAKIPYTFILNLLKASEGRELKRQLEGIASTLESGDYRGRLLMYQNALEEYARWMYLEGRGGGFNLVDPALRVLALQDLLLCGGSDTPDKVIDLLGSEVNPEVYTAVLELLTGHPFPGEQRLIDRVEAYIVGGESWQQSAVLVDRYFRFLASLLSDNENEIRSADLRRRAISAIQTIYQFLNDPALRREALKLNS